jgi:RNA polymerase sigma factor (sigma-70 family)
MTEKNSEISAVVVRERSPARQLHPQAGRQSDGSGRHPPGRLFEFVEEYRLPESIEQASAWLFKVARNRIIDRFRKKKEVALSETGDDDEYRLDLALPSPDAGPEAEYARAVLLDALREALDELPGCAARGLRRARARGRSFKEMSAQVGVAHQHPARAQSARGAASARAITDGFDELEI